MVEKHNNTNVSDSEYLTAVNISYVQVPIIALCSSMDINDETKISAKSIENTDVTDERLKGIEPRMIELINNEVANIYNSYLLNN